ncbi:MAG: NAD(P)-dependent alcohol dehydrogenase [Hyphomonadaceae bacterium]
MKYAFVQAPGGLDKLHIGQRAEPKAGAGEILVRVRASSLNYHDLSVVLGRLPTSDGRVPMSDGACEVVALGDGVTEFKPGDAALSLFLPRWKDGPARREKIGGVPGDHVDGFASEYVAMPANAFTRAPAGYSMQEAATLPCAALTAWRALMACARIKPGDWVVTQGTGGVSIFALQFAKAAGARVIATSSSDEKLDRLRVLGADHLINYKQVPAWGKTAKELTGGEGVDEVVEVGGPGTFAQSIAASRVGGHISLIGVLTGRAGEISTSALFSNSITVSGVTVGSRQDQLDMIRAIEANGVKPVIDSDFPLDEIAGAFAHQMSQRHFGKICLSI